MPNQAQKDAQQNQPKKKPAGDAARSTDPELQNEGEGSRSATRRYDQQAESAAHDERKVQELAEKARKSLEGSEGEMLRQAEERGKNARHR